MNQMIYIVVRAYGTYEEPNVDNMKAFFSREDAEAYAEKLIVENERYNELCAKLIEFHPKWTLDNPHPCRVPGELQEILPEPQRPMGYGTRELPQSYHDEVQRVKTENGIRGKKNSETLDRYVQKKKTDQLAFLTEKGATPEELEWFDVAGTYERKYDFFVEELECE